MANPLPGIKAEVAYGEIDWRELESPRIEIFIRFDDDPPNPRACGRCNMPRRWPLHTSSTIEGHHWFVRRPGYAAR